MTAPPFNVLPDAQSTQQGRARRMVGAGRRPIVVREATLTGGADHLRAACACDGAGGRHLVISVLGVDLTAHADIESIEVMLLIAQGYLGLAKTRAWKVIDGLSHVAPYHDHARAAAYDGFGVVYLGQPEYALTDDERAKLLAWAATNPDAYASAPDLRSIGDSTAIMQSFITLVDDHFATHGWEAGQPYFTSTQRARRAAGERPLDLLRTRRA